MNTVERTLTEAEMADDKARTQPIDDNTVAELLEARQNILLGMAGISALTLKIDKLLQTSRVSNSALLTTALKSMKRDLLVGLAQVQSGLQKGG